VLVASGRFACLLQLLSTTKIYVFPPGAPSLPAGFIVKPQLLHRDTQKAVGVADARTPDVESCEARQVDDRPLPDLRPRCARATMRSATTRIASAAAHFGRAVTCDNHPCLQRRLADFRDTPTFCQSGPAILVNLRCISTAAATPPHRSRLACVRAKCVDGMGAS
jgi:hypothetical protein